MGSAAEPWSRLRERFQSLEVRRKHPSFWLAISRYPEFERELSYIRRQRSRNFENTVDMRPCYYIESCTNRFYQQYCRC